MKDEFCLNPASMPAGNSNEADTYLDAIFTGIASLCQRPWIGYTKLYRKDSVMI